MVLEWGDFWTVYTEKKEGQNGFLGSNFEKDLGMQVGLYELPTTISQSTQKDDFSLIV